MIWQDISIEEMPDLQKTGKRITYPKFARIDNTVLRQIWW